MKKKILSRLHWLIFFSLVFVVMLFHPVTAQAKGKINGLIISGMEESGPNDTALLYNRLSNMSMTEYTLNKNDIHIYKYNDKKDTWANMIKFNEWIEYSYKNTMPQDLSYFYYSGHSTFNRNSDGTFDGEGLTIGGGSHYDYKKLAEKLSSSTKGKIIIILDTCFAENFYTKGVKLLNRNDQDRITVLASCNQQQMSTTGNVLPMYLWITGARVVYGDFTYAIGKGTGFTEDILYADINRDNKITASELCSYTRANVKNADKMTVNLYGDYNQVIFEYKIQMNLGVKELTVQKNKKKQIPFTLKNAYSQNIQWKSSSDKIATVNSDGVVTGKNAGTATITASINGIKKTCTVRVENKNTKVHNPKLIRLKPGTTHTKYDADGDGKADKIEIISDGLAKYEYVTSFKIKVNNKQVLNMNFTQGQISAPALCIQLCTLANGKVYFFVEGTGDSMWEQMAKLYQYKNGKFNTVFDCRNLLNENHNGYTRRLICEINSVKNNTINFRYTAVLYTTAGLHFNVPVKYSNGKMVLATKTYNLIYDKTGRKNSWTIMRKMQTFTTARMTKKSFTLTKGEIVKINKIYIKSQTPYIQIVRKDGRSGWFKCSKIHEFRYFFYEAIFAN